MNKAKLVVVILLLVGALNLLPLVVAFAPDRTQSLYGITLQGDVLITLMRHRAVLLGLVGAALIYAAFNSTVRIAVISAALLSKFAFMLLYWLTNEANPQLKRVAISDVVATILLLIVVAVSPPASE